MLAYTRKLAQQPPKQEPPEDNLTVQTIASEQALAVSTEPAGLGNRIKSWVSAMRLGTDVRVYWPISPIMPASFGELFANDCEVVEIPEGAREYISWRLVILPEDEAYLPAGFAVVGAGGSRLSRGTGKLLWQLGGRKTDRYQYMVFPKKHSRRSARADARHIDFEYGRIPEYFRKVYCPLFDRIQASPSIAERVSEWGGKYIDDDVIGLQVRTWRDDPRRHRKYHLRSQNQMLRLMRAAPENKRFFLVSDSDDVAESLRPEFGAERILCYPRSTSIGDSWKSSQGTQEDLIDMLLLARTQEMFVSYMSTFSETAWWFGGARARVAVF
jgi:hypothetical protein